VSYQQVAKFDPKTRVVASTWEQEIVLAECADGAQARVMVERIGLALAATTGFLDLREVVLTPSHE
jgi:NAD dependent epimerase/dehydratase family enzyme